MQKHEPEVVKLGPISMGERLRIGADFDSDEEADVATPAPTPPPQQPKRQYKRKTADTSEGARTWHVIIETLLPLQLSR